MQALTVTPRRPGTVAVSQLPEPVGADDERRFHQRRHAASGLRRIDKNREVGALLQVGNGGKINAPWRCRFKPTNTAVDEGDRCISTGDDALRVPSDGARAP